MGKSIKLPKIKNSASQINTKATKGSPDHPAAPTKKLPAHSGGLMKKDAYSC